MNSIIHSIFIIAYLNNRKHVHIHVFVMHCMFHCRRPHWPTCFLLHRRCSVTVKTGCFVKIISLVTHSGQMQKAWFCWGFFSLKKNQKWHLYLSGMERPKYLFKTSKKSKCMKKKNSASNKEQAILCWGSHVPPEWFALRSCSHDSTAILPLPTISSSRGTEINGWAHARPPDSGWNYRGGGVRAGVVAVDLPI